MLPRSTWTGFRSPVYDNMLAQAVRRTGSRNTKSRCEAMTAKLTNAIGQNMQEHVLQDLKALVTKAMTEAT